MSNLRLNTSIYLSVYCRLPVIEFFYLKEQPLLRTHYTSEYGLSSIHFEDNFQQQKHPINIFCNPLIDPQVEVRFSFLPPFSFSFSYTYSDLQWTHFNECESVKLIMSYQYVTVRIANTW